MSARRLQDKICVITGIAGGRGKVAARRFAAAGAKVVGCDVRLDEGRATVEAVRAEVGEIAWYPDRCGLSDADAAHRFADFAASAYGGIDVLYNNAAQFHGDWIESMSDETWRNCVTQELDIVFYLTKAVWSHLVRRGDGSIINTASIAD